VLTALPFYVRLPRALLPAYPSRGGVDFSDYISDCTKSQSNSMTFAVRGIPQHTFREMRFADLLFVTWRHRIPCFIEDSPQELDRRWIVCATIAHKGYSTSSPPIRQAIMTSRRMYDDRGHKLLQAVRPK
jgi:hypothetical protein